MYSLLYLTAINLPNALPPMVMAAIIALISIDTQKSKEGSNIILTVIAAEHAPDMMPHTSPMTSAHMFDTFSALFTKKIAVRDPGTFLDAIDKKGASSQDVTATAIPSNNILTVMSIIMTNIATKRLLLLAVISDKKLKNIVIKKDITVILIVHIDAEDLRVGRFFSLVGTS